jgi:hypothetical protein
MTRKYSTPSLVDLAIRCDCGASVVGRVHRWAIPRIIKGFGATHHAKCRKGSPA